MNYKALAFDLDGTLIDSKIDFHSMRKELGLEQGELVLETLAGLPEAQRIRGLEIVDRHEKSGAYASMRIAGAAEFISRARKENLPCAVFTRNSRETALWSLTTHEISFDLLVSRDDAAPKPDPGGLIKIASAFSVRPSELLFVGDYLYDLQAGLRAGTPTALHLIEEADFSTEGAVFTFSAFSELDAWFFS